jgi:hypothetical protein
MCYIGLKRTNIKLAQQRLMQIPNIRTNFCLNPVRTCWNMRWDWWKYTMFPKWVHYIHFVRSHNYESNRTLRVSSSCIRTVPLNFHAYFLTFVSLLGRVANLESLTMILQVSSNSCLTGSMLLRSRSRGVNTYVVAAVSDLAGDPFFCVFGNYGSLAEEFLLFSVATRV